MKKFFSVLTLFAMAVMLAVTVPQHTVNAVEMLPATSQTPSPGCSFLGIEGKYVTQIEEALARINEIRLEACSEGVRNPLTGEPLTPDDYVPLKWSSDLEYIARIRAAESSVTIGHARTNGKSIWFGSPNGVYSGSEDIAWYWGESMTTGVDLWYTEKSDWVDDIPGSVTGHYTSV